MIINNLYLLLHAVSPNLPMDLPMVKGIEGPGLSPGTGAHRGQGLIVGADGRGSRDQQIAEFPEAPNAHVDQGLLAQDPKKWPLKWYVEFVFLRILYKYS